MAKMNEKQAQAFFTRPPRRRAAGEDASEGRTALIVNTDDVKYAGQEGDIESEETPAGMTAEEFHAIKMQKAKDRTAGIRGRFGRY